MGKISKFELSERIANNFWDKNYAIMGIPVEQASDAAAHLINLGASMLRHKFRVVQGGSFVEAYVDNDLREAVGRADHITILGFRYFSMLLYNCTLSETDSYNY